MFQTYFITLFIHTKILHFIIFFFDLETNLHLFHISIHVLDKHTYTLRDRYITPVFIYTSTFNWLSFIWYDLVLKLWLFSYVMIYLDQNTFCFSSLTGTKIWLHFNDFIYNNKHFAKHLTSIVSTWIECNLLLLLNAFNNC